MKIYLAIVQEQQESTNTLSFSSVEDRDVGIKKYCMGKAPCRVKSSLEYQRHFLDDLEPEALKNSEGFHYNDDYWFITALFGEIELS